MGPKDDVELGGAGRQEMRRYDPLQRRRPRERGGSTTEVSDAKDVVNPQTSIGNEVLVAQLSFLHALATSSSVTAL
jgi:hypothetical protein